MYWFSFICSIRYFFVYRYFRTRQVSKKRHPISWGIEAGSNFADYVYGQTGGGETISSNPIAGGRVGVLVEIPVHGGFYLQPGLYYALNGASNDYYDNTWYVNTLEVPVNIMYKFSQFLHSRFFIGAGPYFGYNFSGSYNSQGNTGSLRIGTSESDDIKPIDVGLGFNAGYELKCGFFFRVRYQIGLTNLQPQTGIDYSTVNNESYGLQVGFIFGRNSKSQKNAEGQQYPHQQVWNQ